MSDSKLEHDFNWMREYLACSIDSEFVRLEEAAKAATDTYRAAWQKQYPQSGTEFTCESQEDNSLFVVSRVENKKFSNSGVNVAFRRKEDYILAEVHRGNRGGGTHKITVTLNNDGNCRFKIDDQEGEYLRWQVLKFLLLRVVFTRPI